MHYKKILSSLLILSLIAGVFPMNGNAASISTDFNVKLSSAGDEAYGTTLSNVSNNNTDVTFQFVELSSGGAEEYSISLPAGFTYQSAVSSETTCQSYSVVSSTNANYRFSFSGTTNPCLTKVAFTYRITSSAGTGTKTISLLGKNGSSWDAISSMSIGIVSNNTIMRARSVDADDDGYIDGYLLSFSSTGSLSANALSGITVAGVTRSTATASGSSNWIIPFADGTHDSGDTPQIGGTFDGITLTNGSITEEDGARPHILQLNGVTLATLGVGQSVNIGTGSLIFLLSERMSESSTGAFSLSLGGSPVSGSYAYNGSLDQLTFTPSSALSPGTYTLTTTTGATDWSSNSNTLSQTLPALVVSDTSAPAGSALGSGTGILINAGNLATNNQSVQLQFLASDNVGVAEMMVSNASNFASASWETYATSKTNWLLSSGTGSKTVYAKFRDYEWNTSATYSDSIAYDTLASYINFDPVSSLYTNATSIALSGACSHISSTGSVLSTTINTYVGAINIGSVSCTGNRWSQTFTGLTPNAANTLKVEYSADASLMSTVVITNPVPSCTAVSNGTVGGTYPNCTLSCNAGYTKVGGACVANNCAASTQTVNTRSYSLASFNNGATTTGTSSTIAIANGTITYTQTFSCTLGTVATSGSEGTNTPTCNSGYTPSGTTCVASSSGGGGGGGGWGGGGGGSTPLPTTPTNTGATVSTGVTSTGSSSLPDPVAPWIPVNEFDPSYLSLDSIDTKFFGNISDTHTYLRTRIQDRRVLKLADSYESKITIPEASYFLSVDPTLFPAYNRVLNAYTILFLRVNDAVLGNRSESVKNDGRESYKVVASGITLAKNLLDRYVARSVIADENITVYRTNISGLQKPLLALETKILSKLTTQRDSGIISATEYSDAVSAYNNFVLGLSMYRTYDKHPLAKDRAMKGAKIFLAAYSKKWTGIPAVNTNTTTTSEPTPAKKLVGDAYSFARDVRLGETSDDVRNLQTVLRSYGYFDRAPTGYFWVVTKDFVVKFSRDILGIENPDGLVNAKIREAIKKLEMK